MKKYASIFISLLLLISCSDSETVNYNQQVTVKWTENIKADLLEGCTGSTSVFGISDKHTIDYCNCSLTKTMEKYPDPELIKERLPWDFVIQSGVDCIGMISKLYKDSNNKYHLNKEKFLFSVFSFKKAFEIESLVETEAQQKEYESLLRTGVDLSYSVRDDFLNELHPELLTQYRQHLIQGGIYLLKGNTTEDDVDMSLKLLSDGADLVNDWGVWWNNHAVQLINKIH